MKDIPKLIALTCLASVAAVPAQAQVAAAAGSIGTGMVIQQIGGELRQTLDKATASGDFLAMRGAQEGLYILDAFRATSTDILDVAFDRIGKERQAVLNGVREQVQAIESGRIDTLARLESATDQLNNLVQDVTFKSYPVIYRFRGGLVTPGERQNVVLRIDGYKLARAGTPHVIFRGARYTPQVIGNNLRVELPRGIFSANPDSMRSETAKLHISYEEGGIFGYFATKKVVQYDLNIITLPRNLASISTSYVETVEEPRQEVWDRQENHRRYGGRGGGWDCRSYAYSPKVEGRRYDVNATSVMSLNGNGNGRIEGVSIRDVGISFRICARWPLFAGGPGFRHAAVHATEIWTEKVDKPHVSTADLSWTGDVTVPMPATIKNLVVTATDFSGNRRSVSAAGGDAGRYVRVKYDRDSNVVIVAPIVPADVNAL